MFFSFVSFVYFCVLSSFLFVFSFITCHVTSLSYFIDSSLGRLLINCILAHCCDWITVWLPIFRILFYLRFVLSHQCHQLLSAPSVVFRYLPVTQCCQSCLVRFQSHFIVPQSSYNPPSLSFVLSRHCHQLSLQSPFLSLRALPSSTSTSVLVLPASYIAFFRPSVSPSPNRTSSLLSQFTSPNHSSPTPHTRSPAASAPHFYHSPCIIAITLTTIQSIHHCPSWFHFISIHCLTFAHSSACPFSNIVS